MLQLYDIAQQPGLTMAALVIVGLWTTVWEGIALWFAGKHQQKAWFIALLVLNTLGLLPIIYLIWFKPKKKREGKRKTPSSRN